MNNEPSDKLALALDNISDEQTIHDLISKTRQWIGVYKIGLEQFIRFGPPIVERIKKYKRRIFLDLKLHDIPNTVAKAVLCACELEVDYLTIHTQGGSEMMRAAKEATRQSTRIHTPKIIGVTVLTSIDSTVLQNELKVPVTPSEYVRHLTRCAAAIPIDGIVCSAADLPTLSGSTPTGFEIITPGIRPAGNAHHDQKRVATPAVAIKHGATLLVLGRAITAANDPTCAAADIHTEIASATTI